jgi:hypothetical protein
MYKVQTSEVDVIPAPFSLAQQCIKIGEHSWVGQETMRLVAMFTSPIM